MGALLWYKQIVNPFERIFAMLEANMLLLDTILKILIDRRLIYFIDIRGT